MSGSEPAAVETALDGPRIRALASSFCVPRAAGSHADPRIRAKLRARLEGCGYHVDEQGFRYTLRDALIRLRVGLALFALAVGWLGASVLAPSWWGLGIGVLMFAAGFAATRASMFDDACLLDRNDRPLSTANLVARVPNVTKAPRVVIMAHHDSKSQNISFLLRGLLVTLGLIGLAASLSVSLGFLFGAEVAAPARWAAAVSGGLGALALAGLAWISFGDESPGGLDNGASVAVVLDVAGRLAGTPEQEDVLVVLPGAEEHLMAGARVLARTYADAWISAGTRVINLDGVGAPGPVGVVARKSIAAKSLSVARAAGIPARRVILPPGTGTDALPLERAGVHVQTLSSGALSRSVMQIHTCHDTVDNLDDTALAHAANLLERLIHTHLTTPAPRARPRRHV